MELKDKICLITGGTKGIGAATALLFAQLGAKVAVVGRNLKDSEAEETQKRLSEFRARFIAMPADMARADDCLACVQRTQKELGDVDVLVHSAGGPVPGGLLEITPQSWHAAFDVHVHAIFHLCRAVVPAMKKKREGAIILISSTAGRRAIKTNIAYQAVKGAVPHITRALAYELADDNIRRVVSGERIGTLISTPAKEES